MEFCPECDSLLYPSKVNGKSVLKCKCGYIKKLDEQVDSASITLETRAVNSSIKREIEIIDDSSAILPTKNEECPKCHNLKAYYWQVQTRSGDESMTIFFRCSKCRYTWREY